jgi:F-type H+-transporting ATPase subunit delta
MSGFAGRYATALFDLAEQGRVIDEVTGELDRLQSMIDDAPDLARMIKSPLLGRAAQGRAIDAVMEAAGMSGLTRRFVGVVAANRRIFALPDMIKAFCQLLARHRGEASAEVTSAAPLNQAQIDALAAQLKQVTGVNVTLSTHVDPAIIGGLVVKLGSRMVDSSLRTKLQKLELAMKGAA